MSIYFNDEYTPDMISKKYNYFTGNKYNAQTGNGGDVQSYARSKLQEVELSTKVFDKLRPHPHQPSLSIGRLYGSTLSSLQSNTTKLTSTSPTVPIVGKIVSQTSHEAVVEHAEHAQEVLCSDPLVSEQNGKAQGIESQDEVIELERAGNEFVKQGHGLGLSDLWLSYL
jgi:hypothetical protein